MTIDVYEISSENTLEANHNLVLITISRHEQIINYVTVVTYTTVGRIAWVQYAFKINIDARSLMSSEIV